MALNVVLLSQKQSGKGIFLSWNAMEGVASYLVFVATRKLSPDELEAALAKGGSDECAVVKLGADVTSIVDDCSAEGEPHFYGVAMNFSDGAPRSARFRAVPDGAPAGTLTLSSKGMKKASPRPVAAPTPAAAPSPAAPAAVPARPAAAPATAASASASAAGTARAPGASPTGNTGSYRVGTPAAAAAASPASANPSPARPAASASPTGNTGAYKINSGAAAAPAAAPAPRPAAEEDPLEAQKRAQREARAQKPPEPSPTSSTGGYKINTAAAAPAAAPAPEPSAEEQPAEEDPIEAQKRAQREARAKLAAQAAEPVAERPRPEARPPAPAPRAETPAPAAPAQVESLSNTAFYRVANPTAAEEAVAPPRDFPLEEPLSFRMQGGTQSWDGLRLYWERAEGAAAYEIVISDHQIFGDELGDAIAGRADFTSCTAVGPNTLAVIDNVTTRDSRGWYLLLARDKRGVRTVHPFQIGDAQQSGKTVAPFANPNRTGELRGEVEGMLEDAREQWSRWKSEQDGGARREAKRLVQDALLIYPNHPGAAALSRELG